MNTSEIRQQFLNFFREKSHTIVPSAPVVLKNDPTLMFVNAGMNQFKDRFLGNQTAGDSRVADAQKCLRVSGKHNDLEDVGVDTYHHTLFEMLGNWSFGDYFKKEALSWAWEFLTEEMKLPKERLYVTYFEGDEQDGISADEDTREIWKQFLPEERILTGNKKDNFWEMGETGPCGPCSEIHIDWRSEEEIAKSPGTEWVNKDHPLVIELWNVVFISFNRKANGQLEPLPNKHVDTGMGLERLAMVMQEKKSNYDTDVFAQLIGKVEDISGENYEGKSSKKDIAFRVISDHIRALSFTMADGQLPSNVGAGYVIRRILRRAVRYGYSFLGLKEPFLHQLVSVLVKTMGEYYTELDQQKGMLVQVIREEEESFYRTLEKGISKLDELTQSESGTLDGKTAFELYDTFGFPLDLTHLILKEKGWRLDEKAFQEELQKQKERSRKATKLQYGDWIELLPGTIDSEFVGYDSLETETAVKKYREVKEKDKTFYQIVLTQTPFYPEGGGQVGDKGSLWISDEKEIKISNTQKENELIVHTTYDDISKIAFPEAVMAEVFSKIRRDTQRNHSATHLLHYALRVVLGNHVEQKGSLVNEKYLRFDFSHFKAMSPEEIEGVDKLVNLMVLDNIRRDEFRTIDKDKAVEMGAMALFGEKYGDKVRAIRFGDSIELCGGTHVASTGEIGFCKIVSESGVASGVRRIEMLTGEAAIARSNEKENLLESIGETVKNQKDPLKAVENLVAENKMLVQELAGLKQKLAGQEKNELLKDAVTISGGVRFIGKKTDLAPDSIKDICFQWKGKEEKIVAILGTENKGKAMLSVMVTPDLVDSNSLNAGELIRTISTHIQGGGGGQSFFATAGGKNPAGLQKAIEEGKALVEKSLE